MPPICFIQRRGKGALSLGSPVTRKEVHASHADRQRHSRPLVPSGGVLCQYVTETWAWILIIFNVMCHRYRLSFSTLLKYQTNVHIVTLSRPQCIFEHISRSINGPFLNNQQLTACCWREVAFASRYLVTRLSCKTIFSSKRKHQTIPFGDG